uniref:LRAT domain-containing protein n=1 Tax=Salarias fasciatus TaxID=181472 RepID=A0A672J3K0_SALFA
IQTVCFVFHSKYNQKPEPGDLIEIFRGPYEHWAVYVGDGYVVHLTANLSSVPNKNGLVYKEKLQDVVGTNKWRVNNILDNKYRPRPVDDIVKDACALVGKKVTYDVSSSNCEHFATGLRYEKLNISCEVTHLADVKPSISSGCCVSFRLYAYIHYIHTYTAFSAL